MDVERPPTPNKEDFEIYLEEAKGKFGVQFTGITFDGEYPVIVPDYDKPPETPGKTHLKNTETGRGRETKSQAEPRGTKGTLKTVYCYI